MDHVNIEYPTEIASWATRLYAERGLGAIDMITTQRHILEENLEALSHARRVTPKVRVLREAIDALQEKALTF